MKSRDTIIGNATIFGLAITFLQTLYFVYAFYNKPQELSNSDIGLIITILATHVVSVVMATQLFKLTKRQDELIRQKENSSQKLNDLKEKNESEILKLNKKINYFEKSINTLATTNHNINHSIRDVYSKIYNNILGVTDTEFEENDSEEVIKKKLEISITESKASYKSFLQLFLSNIKKFYDDYTKDDCSVYIALITDQLGDTDNFYVTTYYRDPISYQRRSQIDKKHPEYLSNDFYPFKYILSSEVSDAIFANDDCIHTLSFRDRINDWHKHYNAIIAVPIRKSENNFMSGYSNLGFLVIDNKKGKLNNDVAIETLKAHADVLYHLFILFDDMSELIGTTFEIVEKKD